MASRIVASAKERLNKTRINDKVVEIEGMLKTLKAEEYKLLTNFMYLSISDLDLYVDITEDGQYVLTVKAITDRLIDIGKFL